MRLVGCMWLAALACGGSQRAPLAPAGAGGDEGGGELARQSVQLALGPDEREAAESAVQARGNAGGETYGGDVYGGGMYGGDPYGGASYAGFSVPQWSYSTPNRIPHYNIGATLTGAVAGTVRWSGATPGKLTTACGAIDNPTLHVGSDKGVRGVIVYIEKVSVGRQLPYYGRPATVGGVVAKHGCALLPAAQIVAPLPTALAIHGDATHARLRIASKSYELQEGGVVQLEARPGVTRIDADDGKLVSAWVLGLDTPYYAITDDSGRFRIDDLAPGTYDVTFWQAPVASAAPDGTFAYGAPIVVHRSVKVEAARPARLDLLLPSH